jgi:hypothetical protein
MSLVLALTACATTPSPESSAQPGPEAVHASTSGGTLIRILDAALERGSWEDLRIESECQDDTSRLRSAVLLGSGIGIWNHERQITVPRERLLDLLGELSQAGFGAMPETHGGKDDPGTDRPGAWAMEMICRVRLRLDGVEKQSFQLSKGRQDAALRELAGKILSVAEELGSSGVAAASLEDGLAKLASGELAPETLTLQLQRQPENPNAPEGGWILRIEEGRAQISFNTPADGWTEPRRVPLAREEVSALARTLAAAGLDDLPVNLYSSFYEDFEVRVLNQRKTLQARRFANVTPDTHGEKQKRFDQLIAKLEELEARVAG